MRLNLAALTVLIACGSVSATDLAILRASLDPGNKEVSVEMSIKNPPIPTGGASAAAHWQIEIDDAKGTPISDVLISNVALMTVGGTPTDNVILKLTTTASLQNWSAVVVTYKDGGSHAYHFVGRPGVKRKTIVGADSKDDADVYAKGSYSPSINSPAQYSYDVAVGYGLPYFTPRNPSLGRLGISTTASADKRKNIDPDSYYAGLFWQVYPVRMPHGVLQGVLVQVDTGGEFALKKLGNETTRTTNYLAPAPRLIFPMRLYPFPNHGGGPVFATLKPLIGFDGGKNFENAVQPNGSGAIARLVAGADFDVTYKPKKPFLYSLTLSSSWRGRYPRHLEIDTTSKYNATKQDYDFSFNPTKKPRNHVTSKLEWKLSEFFGITVSHEIGAEPPVFNYVDQSVSIGFTFSALFAKDGVQRRQ